MNKKIANKRVYMAIYYEGDKDISVTCDDGYLDHPLRVEKFPSPVWVETSSFWAMGHGYLYRYSVFFYAKNDKEAKKIGRKLLEPWIETSKKTRISPLATSAPRLRPGPGIAPSMTIAPKDSAILRVSSVE